MGAQGVEELGSGPEDDWTKDAIVSCVLEPTASMPHVGTHWRAALDLKQTLSKSEN